MQVAIVTDRQDHVGLAGGEFHVGRSLAVSLDGGLGVDLGGEVAEIVGHGVARKPLGADGVKGLHGLLAGDEGLLYFCVWCFACLLCHFRIIFSWGAESSPQGGV